MPATRIAALVALFGAAGMLSVCGTPLQMFVSVIQPPTDAAFSAQLLVGVIGAVLFALGICGVVFGLVHPAPKARGALVAAAVALVIALVAIGYGNTCVAMAFSNLATSETMNAQQYEYNCLAGVTPITVGYGLILAAAALLLAAAWTSPRREGVRRSLVGFAALFVTLPTAAVLVLAYLMAWRGAREYERLLGMNQIMAHEVADALSGGLMGVYLVAMTLSVFALACLLLAFARGRSKEPAGDVEPTGSEEPAGGAEPTGDVEAGSE